MGAPGLVKGCSGRRGPAALHSIPGDSVSSGLHLSFHYWAGELRGVVPVRKSPLEQSPLEFLLLLGGGERPLWWGLLLFGLFYPS